MIKLQIRVIPNGKFNKIVEFKEDDNGILNIKLKVTSPPVDNKANQAVIDLLADFFDIKKSNIEILLGHTSRQKVIAIHNTDKNLILKNIQLRLI